MKMIAVSLVLSAAVLTSGHPLAAQTVNSGTVSLPDRTIPASYQDMGPAPDTLPSGRVLLFLNRTAAQQLALDTLVHEQSDPASPNYHHFLTPTDFGKQFGPSDKALQQISEWLQSNGLSVSRTLAGRLALEITGTRAQLESAFHTQIHAFASPADPGSVLYANATPPQVPAELAPHIKSVTLSNFGPHPLNRRVGSFELNSRSGIGATQAVVPVPETANPLFNITGYHPCAPTGVCYAVVPGDVATIYNTKPLLAAGIDGTGVTIGIPAVSNIDLPTVQRFRTLFLPKYSATNLPNVILDGQDPGLETGGTYEAYIDVETAGGTAPNATINLYAAADTPYTNGLTLAIARAVEDDTISILSVSFGECEANLGSYNTQFLDLYEQATAEGITVLNASGDSGSAGCDPPPNTSVGGPYQASYGLGVNGLASTPYNLAVGGTDFLYPANATAANFNQYWQTPSTTSPNNNADWSSALSYIPEKPWNDSNPILDQFNAEQFAAGGGGQSSCAFNNGASPAVCQGGYPKPAWQQGFGYDAVRDIPDLSLFSATGSNYSFYAICISLPLSNGTDCSPTNASPNSTATPIYFAGFGGTSVSTPLMAGILALVSQKTQTPRLGLAMPNLYAVAKQFPAVFHDVTSGTNAVSCVIGSPNCGSNGYESGYAATAGFDLATGLGSVDANQLVTDWAKVSPASIATTTTLSLTPKTAPHQSVVTFTVNVTASPTAPASGAIAIFGGTSSAIQTTNDCAAFPCTFTFNGLPGGTYPVTARFIGNGAYASSTSAPVTVTISPEATELLILNQFNANSAYQPNGLNGITNAQLGQALGFIVAPAPINTPATASFTSLNFPPPTGTVTILDNGSSLGSPITLDTLGSLSYLSTSFGLGNHSLVVKYSGDSSYGPSDSTQPIATPLNFTVIKASSGITFGGLPLQVGAPVGYALTISVYLNAAVNQYNYNFPNPTGTVTFTVNGTALPPVNLNSTYNQYNSVANLTIPGNLITQGTITIQASYSGDANYTTFTGQTSTQGVFFPTNSYLGAIPTTASAGNPITFYLEVARNYGPNFYQDTIPANVTVTLLDGTTPFATVPLAPDTSRISADAQYAYSGLSQGTHTITMQYPGDSGDQPSSASLTVVITPGVPGFNLAATPVTLAAGLSSPNVTSTLTLTPTFGFTGTVTLQCYASQLPQGSCSLPGSVNIGGASPTTVPVTISIMGNTASNHPIGPLLPTGAIAACLMLGLCFTRPRGKSQALHLLGVALVSAFLLANLTACGSKGSSFSLPSGSYTVGINATSGSVSKTVTIPVTVQ